MTAIAPQTTLGAVSLTVADLDATSAFYERVLGLRLLERTGETALLGAADDVPLVDLVARADAPPRERRACGLFHLALLLPSREELARSLARIAVARWPLSGASDHLVSEALYLDDPEGNGIELYRDRPRGEWRRSADGELAMATLPLDLDGLIAELPGGLEAAAGAGPVPAATRMGHVHLQVADLAGAERFYADTLGFEVMVRGYPGALFVAAGGYHHHLGLNTWASAGGPPRAAGARGLRHVTVTLPDAAELAHVTTRLEAAGTPLRDTDGGLVATDPFGIDVLLRSRA